jgi:hypothetical protein
MDGAKTEHSVTAVMNAEKVFRMNTVITHGKPVSRSGLKHGLSTAPASETQEELSVFQRIL